MSGRCVGRSEDTEGMATAAERSATYWGMWVSTWLKKGVVKVSLVEDVMVLFRWREVDSINTLPLKQKYTSSFAFLIIMNIKVTHELISNDCPTTALTKDTKDVIGSH